MVKKKKESKKEIIVNFLLDETGSMGSCKESTINGFNEYVKTLQNKEDNISLTLTKFNSEKIDVVYVNKPIKDVPQLDNNMYVPDHLTPLYDAIGQTIHKVDSEVKSGDKLMVILTDGLENASKEYTREGIFSLIKEKEKTGWTFAFLGANQDAWVTGGHIGIVSSNTFTFSTKDMKRTFRAAGMATRSYSMGNRSNLFKVQR